MGDPRTFDEAVAQFRTFLWERGVSGELIWVEPEDLLLTGSRRYYVRLSGFKAEKKTAGRSAPSAPRIPVGMTRLSANEARARELFVSRTGTDAGVGFRVVAFAPEGLCCCVTKRTVAGVRFSVPIEESRVEAVGVRGRFRWWWLGLKYKVDPEMGEAVFGK